MQLVPFLSAEALVYQDEREASSPIFALWGIGRV